MDGHGSHVTFGSGLQGYANWTGLGDFAFSYLTQVAATRCECVSTFQMCFSRLQGRIDIAQRVAHLEGGPRLLGWFSPEVGLVTTEHHEGILDYRNMAL